MTVLGYDPSNRNVNRILETNESMEDKHEFFRADSARGRRFFRGERKVSDIIASSKLPFVEFVDHMPELQLSLDMPYEIDELDKESDCGASCEAYGGESDE